MSHSTLNIRVSDQTIILKPIISNCTAIVKYIPKNKEFIFIINLPDKDYINIKYVEQKKIINHFKK
jgi:hypothetical protein